MRIGIQLHPQLTGSLEELLDDFVRAEAEGFDTVWMGQVFDVDVLTIFALAGQRTQRIELGTSVIPIPTRHPSVLAQQALTTQLASGGRLCLGVGSGHAAILDKKLGLASDRPVGRTREALEVLRPLLRGEYVKHSGEFQRMRVGTPILGASAPSVILAALGPRMIELASELADGVTLVFAGAEFVAERVRPKLQGDARIVASLPVGVTNERTGMASLFDEFTAPSAVLPPYQRTLAAQAISRVSDLGLLGSEDEVGDGLDALAASGVTDLNPILVSGEADPGCAERTRAFLAARARSLRT
jgi:F420-dependent oxidoreductase-like protein